MTQQAKEGPQTTITVTNQALKTRNEDLDLKTQLYVEPESLSMSQNDEMVFRAT